MAIQARNNNNNARTMKRENCNLGSLFPIYTDLFYLLQLKEMHKGATFWFPRPTSYLEFRGFSPLFFGQMFTSLEKAGAKPKAQQGYKCRFFGLTKK
jgi:hypothetical protein